MIVVTGAGGFIGSNIVRRLNEQGRDDIIVVDNVIDNLKDCKFQEHILITKFYSFFKRWDQVEIVYHEGAASDTTIQIMDVFSQMNIGPSRFMLEKSKHHNFILSMASSASVYGNQSNFKETDEMDPMCPYAYSKAVIDEMIEDDLSNVQSFRYFNVYGPTEQHKKHQASPITKFYLQAKKTGTIEIFEGSENFKRDFVCVNDLIDIKFQMAEKKVKGIYNIGTGQPRSFAEVAEIIANKTNAEIKTIPFPENLKNQYQSYTCADTTLLKSVIGDYQFTTVEQYVDSLE